MGTVTFEQLVVLPILRRFNHLAWQLFGVNIAIFRLDGEPALDLSSMKHANPFCFRLHGTPGGWALCKRCNHRHIEIAKTQKQPLRYLCHAGLRELIVPITPDGEVIAFLVGGQVLDAPPTKKKWQRTHKAITSKSVNASHLEAAFFRTSVVAPKAQHDLVELLELFANHIARTQHQMQLLEQSPAMQIAARAQSFIRNHLAEAICLEDIARACYTSTRNLNRVLTVEAGATAIVLIQQARVAHACEQLRQTKKPCKQIATECGFGSVQQFNRVFKQQKARTPLQWRNRQGKNDA